MFALFFLLYISSIKSSCLLSQLDVLLSTNGMIRTSSCSKSIRNFTVPPEYVDECYIFCQNQGKILSPATLSHNLACADTWNIDGLSCAEFTETTHCKINREALDLLEPITNPNLPVDVQVSIQCRETDDEINFVCRTISGSNSLLSDNDEDYNRVVREKCTKAAICDVDIIKTSENHAVYNATAAYASVVDIYCKKENYIFEDNVVVKPDICVNGHWAHEKRPIDFVCAELNGPHCVIGNNLFMQKITRIPEDDQSKIHVQCKSQDKLIALACVTDSTNAETGMTELISGTDQGIICALENSDYCSYRQLMTNVARVDELIHITSKKGKIIEKNDVMRFACSDKKLINGKTVESVVCDPDNPFDFTGYACAEIPSEDTGKYCGAHVDHRMLFLGETPERKIFEHGEKIGAVCLLDRSQFILFECLSTGNWKQTDDDTGKCVAAENIALVDYKAILALQKMVLKDAGCDYSRTDSCELVCMEDYETIQAGAIILDGEMKSDITKQDAKCQPKTQTINAGECHLRDLWHMPYKLADYNRLCDENSDCILE